MGTDEALKRLPKDFDTVTEPDLAAAVKLRHFYVREDIEPGRVTEAGLVGDCVGFVKRAMVLLEWGRAIQVIPIADEILVNTQFQYQ